PSLEDRPAVIGAATGRRRPVAGRAIDLLPPLLADIRDPQGARHPVERPAPRVAETDRPDLVGTRVADIWVRRRVRVMDRAVEVVDVDPEHLAKQRIDVLRPVLRIAGATTVAHADVQVAIGPEGEVAAVVV